MYTRHYGLRDFPFELAPDPRFLFPGPGHREALANIEYALTAFKSLTVLIGEAGTGKSRLCAYAAARGSRPRRTPAIVPAAITRTFLAPLPVSLLRERLARARATPGGAREAAGSPRGSNGAASRAASTTRASASSTRRWRRCAATRARAPSSSGTGRTTSTRASTRAGASARRSA